MQKVFERGDLIEKADVDGLLDTYRRLPVELKKVVDAICSNKLEWFCGEDTKRRLGQKQAIVNFVKTALVAGAVFGVVTVFWWKRLRR